MVDKKTSKKTVKTKKKREKRMIGRLEKVDFPDWEIFNLEAKIDTGAYTSSLHCSYIDTVERQGITWVQFNILDPSHPSFQDTPLSAPLLKKKRVKSSSGVGELRLFIKTHIAILDRTFLSELSLTDRSEMKYPVLLGRKILKNRFIVDVSQKYLSDQLKREEL